MDLDAGLLRWSGDERWHYGGKKGLSYFALLDLWLIILIAEQHKQNNKKTEAEINQITKQ